MSYWNQVRTVTNWEFRRFYKPKNEAIGIAVMLVISIIFYFAGKYALADSDEKPVLTTIENPDSSLTQRLSVDFQLNTIPKEKKSTVIGEIADARKGILLVNENGVFTIHAYKNTRVLKKLRAVLDENHRIRETAALGLNQADLARILSPAPVTESFVYTDNSKNRVLLAFAFALLMIMAVFLSWFPLTSASAMPMRWAITEVDGWQLAGSFIVLVLTFYFLRRLAAKIFRVSILITGKEPSWGELFRLLSRTEKPGPSN